MLPGIVAACRSDITSLGILTSCQAQVILNFPRNPFDTLISKKPDHVWLKQPSWSQGKTNIRSRSVCTVLRRLFVRAIPGGGGASARKQGEFAVAVGWTKISTGGLSERCASFADDS